MAPRLSGDKEGVHGEPEHVGPALAQPSAVPEDDGLEAREGLEGLGPMLPYLFLPCAGEAHARDATRHFPGRRGRACGQVKPGRASLSMPMFGAKHRASYLLAGETISLA